MRITDKTNSPWKDKVNFIDSNDVFVGYDLTEQCCEDAGWFISEEIEAKFELNSCFTNENVFSEIFHNVNKDIEGYVFDRSFFADFCITFDDSGKETKVVIFKMICDNKDPLYLHLFNCHNGYYSHGFECTVSGEKFKEGML